MCFTLSSSLSGWNVKICKHKFEGLRCSSGFDSLRLESLLPAMILIYLVISLCGGLLVLFLTASNVYCAKLSLSEKKQQKKYPINQFLVYATAKKIK